jgi:hypothetical protein
MAQHALMTWHYVRSNDLNPLKDLLTGDMFMDLRRDAASRMKNRTGVWEVWIAVGWEPIWCLKKSPKQTKADHTVVHLLCPINVETKANWLQLLAHNALSSALGYLPCALQSEATIPHNPTHLQPVKELEAPRIVHCRATALETKTNLWVQMTVRIAQTQACVLILQGRLASCAVYFPPLESRLCCARSASARRGNFGPLFVLLNACS